MNKKQLVVACAAAVIGMGIAMPQCPGDKATQNQIDSLRQSQQQMTMKLSTVDSQNRSLQAEVGQTKQLMTQLASAVIAQKDAIDRLNTAVKDLQTEMTKKSAAHAKAKPRSKTKRHH